jgi:hypothetical protein
MFRILGGKPGRVFMVRICRSDLIHRSSARETAVALRALRFAREDRHPAISCDDGFWLDEHERCPPLVLGA